MTKTFDMTNVLSFPHEACTQASFDQVIDLKRQAYAEYELYLAMYTMSGVTSHLDRAIQALDLYNNVAA